MRPETGVVVEYLDDHTHAIVLKIACTTLSVWVDIAVNNPRSAEKMHEHQSA